MAELGVLKHVEVISTVSGGSIVGAAFYLRLLELERERRAPVEDADLVALVQDIARTFPVGVAANVRVRTLTSYPDRADGATGLLAERSRRRALRPVLLLRDRRRFE